MSRSAPPHRLHLPRPAPRGGPTRPSGKPGPGWQSHILLSARHSRLLGCLLLTVACLAVRGADVEGLLVAQQAQQLDGIPASTRVLRLDLPLAKLNADRQETLRAWIAAGGTAWFHTDAAHAVGFETTPPRSDLEAFGKAVSVAPFGSNRLLEGVQRIRYALAQGDALLLPSEDVLALLRAEDLPVGRQEPLFVAGWRRYGFGDAFFLPSEVSHTLLDGEHFSANWRRCLTERPTRLFVPVSAVVGMTGMSSDRTQAEGLTSQECIALANAWAAAFERGETASAAGGSEGRGYMPLDDSDLDRLRAALGLRRPASVAPAAPDMDRVQALAASWLARWTAAAFTSAGGSWSPILPGWRSTSIANRAMRSRSS